MTRSRILVPIDFQRQSDLALIYAGQMASRLNAMISCIHVIDEQGLLADRISGKDAKHRLRREAENKLSERVNSILKNKDNIAFEIIITSGKVYQKVLEKSIDLNAQIILMGRNSSTLDKAVGLGSNAKRIIANSTIPVFTLTNRRMAAIKQVILPLNVSEPFSDQLNWAIETAILLADSVSVISVIEKGQSSLRPVYLKKLEEARCILSERNIACSTNLLENQSTVSREIISFSDKTEEGIILLTKSCKTESTGLYPGSITAEILAKSEAPVLYIQPRNKYGLSMNRSSRYFQAIYPSRESIQDSLI